MLLAVPLILMFVLGVVLTWRGLRGRRVDDHPLCRGCGYDLVANSGVEKCPECGRDVLAAGAVRIGHRRRRMVALTLGIALLLLTSLGGGGIAYTAASGANWNPYKPLWMLRREAGGANGSIATRAEQEIMSRLKFGQLSRAQIDSIVKEALHAQPNVNTAWHLWWGDFIEIGWGAGVVSDQDLIQYARTAMETSYGLQIPPRVRQEAMLMVWLSHAPMRSGRIGSLTAEVQYGDIGIGDGALPVQMSGRSYTSISSGSSGRSGMGMRMKLPVGTQVAHSELSVRILPGRVMAFRMEGTQATPPDNAPDALASFKIPLQATFEVVPSDVEAVERVRDTTLAQAIQNSAKLRLLRATATRRGVELTCEIEFTNPPMPVAFDVFARIGGKEWLLRSASAEPTSPLMGPTLTMGGSSSTLLLPDFPADAEVVDVVLRSSAEVAEKAGLARIWDGEIVLKDVPLKR